MPRATKLLGKKSIYCKSCYWKLKEENKTWSSGEIKKNCKYSKMGCSVCEVVVCKEGWPKIFLTDELSWSFVGQVSIV